MKINLLTASGIQSFDWTITHARALIHAYDQASKLYKTISLFKLLNLMITRPLPNGPGFDGWTILWQRRQRTVKAFRVFTDRIEISMFDDSRKAEVESFLLEGLSLVQVREKTGISIPLMLKMISGTKFEILARENGKKRLKERKPRDKFSHLKKEHRDLIERLLHSGLTVRQIHNQTGITSGQIKHYILGTPLDQIAQENLAEYHFRLEQKKRLAPKRKLYPGMPPELVERIEKMVLSDGMHGAEIVRILSSEGVTSAEPKVYSVINSDQNLKSIAKQNLYLNVRGQPSAGSNPARPEFIYDRYYILSKRDGVLLIDRMSRRFSTKNYWLEYSIRTYPPHKIQQATRDCAKMNRRWQKQVREKYGEEAVMAETCEN